MGGSKRAIRDGRSSRLSSTPADDRPSPSQSINISGRHLRKEPFSGVDRGVEGVDCGARKWVGGSLFVFDTFVDAPAIFYSPESACDGSSVCHFLAL